MREFLFQDIATQHGRESLRCFRGILVGRRDRARDQRRRHGYYVVGG